MRIVHTCLRYPPARGGAENYIRDLVDLGQQLPTRPDVRVLTSKMRTHGPITELDPNELLTDPMYVQRLHHLKTPLFSYPQLQALSYYLAHHQPDIIQSYGYWYQPADTSAKFARQRHIPFIFHPIYYTNRIRQKPIWKLYDRTLGRRTFAAADITVVISPYEQSLIEKGGYPVKRFVMLPPPIDVSRFTSQDVMNPYDKLKITGPVLLSVGRIARSKAFQDVIQVLPQIISQTQAHLVIIGEDFGYKSELERISQDLGIASNIHFLTNISDSDLPAYYQHADIFIFPSRYEAFGIVAAEASAAGLPVLGRNATAIPFTAPHEHSGLLFNNSDELVTHALTLLNSPTLRQTYGHQGRQYVIQNFSPDVIKKKLAELYASASTLIK